jgi:hypothetical protein
MPFIGRIDEVKRAFKKIKSLIDKNAQHRKGFRLQEVDLELVLQHARDELDELADAPDDPTEMADLFSVLIHYSIKQGWTVEFLESLLIEKLNSRFSP